MRRGLLVAIHPTRKSRLKLNDGLSSDRVMKVNAGSPIPKLFDRVLRATPSTFCGNDRFLCQVNSFQRENKIKYMSPPC